MESVFVVGVDDETFGGVTAALRGQRFAAVRLSDAAEAAAHPDPPALVVAAADAATLAGTAHVFRQHTQFDRVPLVLLLPEAARGDALVLEQSDVFADALLFMPFDPAEFARTLSILCGRKQPPPPVPPPLPDEAFSAQVLAPPPVPGEGSRSAPGGRPARAVQAVQARLDALRQRVDELETALRERDGAFEALRRWLTVTQERLRALGEEPPPSPAEPAVGARDEGDSAVPAERSRATLPDWARRYLRTLSLALIFEEAESGRVREQRDLARDAYRRLKQKAVDLEATRDKAMQVARAAVSETNRLRRDAQATRPGPDIDPEAQERALTEVRGERDAARQEAARLTQQIDQTRSAAAAAEARLRRLEADLGAAREAEARVRDELARALTRQAGSDEARAGERAALAESQLQLARSELDDLRIEVSALRATADEGNAALVEREALRRELNELRRELQETALALRRAGSRQASDDSLDGPLSLQAERQRLLSELEAVRAEAETARQTLLAREEENEALRQQVDHGVVQSTRQEAEISSLLGQLEEAQNELQDLKRDLSERATDLRSQDEQVTELLRLLAEAREEASTAQATLDEQKDLVEQGRTALQAERRTVETLRRELEAARVALHSAETQVDQEREINGRARAEKMASLERGRDEALAERDQALAARLKALAERDRALASAEESTRGFEKASRDLTRATGQLEAERRTAASLRQDLAQARANLKQAQEQLRKSQDAFEQAHADLEIERRAVRSLRKEVENTRVALHAAEDEATSAHDESETLRVDLEAAQGQLALKTREASRFAQEVERLAAELERVLDEGRSHVARAAGERQAALQQLKAHEDELRRARQTAAAFERDMAALSNERLRLERQVEDLSTQVAALAAGEAAPPDAVAFARQRVEEREQALAQARGQVRQKDAQLARFAEELHRETTRAEALEAALREAQLELGQLRDYPANGAITLDRSAPQPAGGDGRARRDGLGPAGSADGPPPPPPGTAARGAAAPHASARGAAARAAGKSGPPLTGERS